jgi:hypothetical protein
MERGCISAERICVFVQNGRFRQNHKIIARTARCQPDNELWPRDSLAPQDPAQNSNAFARKHRPQKFSRKPRDEKISPPPHDQGFETGEHQHAMDRQPGKTGRLRDIRVEMQGIVVAGNGRIARERFPRERPEALRADFLADLWPVRRRPLQLRS